MTKRVEEAILGGVDVVQVRDKHAKDEEFLSFAQSVKSVTDKFDVPLIVNDRVNVAKQLGVDGVHLGQEDGSYAWVRNQLGQDILIGRSTHSEEQALRAQEEGFSYVGIGPVFSTPTKPAKAPVGLDLVSFASKKLKVPFVAIGGIDLLNAPDVVAAGARCLCAVRALLGSDQPKSAAQNFVNILTNRGSLKNV